MNYLIWDFDGTLGYREGGMWTLTLLEIVDQALPELGVTFEQLKPFLAVGYPWHSPERPHLGLQDADAWWEALHPVLINAMIGVGVPVACATELVHEFRPRYTDLSHWRLFPDTLPVLSQLTALGWRHIVLSNHVPELPAIIEHLGLLPHLTVIFNSAQTGYEKPHQQAFRNVLESLGNPTAICMIGDNLIADIAGAAALGIPGILVRATHPECKYCSADLTGVEAIISRELSFTRSYAHPTSHRISGSKDGIV